MAGSRALTPVELELIAGNLCAPSELWMIFQLCQYTGLRIGQCLELTIGQVMGIQVLHIPRKGLGSTKQSTPRDIPVHPRLTIALNRYLNALAVAGWGSERKDRLFTLTYDQAEHRLHETVLRLNLPGKVTWHSLRHTFVERMYQKLGKDIVATSRAVGHASVTNTAVYIGVDLDRIKRAILED